MKSSFGALLIIALFTLLSAATANAQADAKQNSKQKNVQQKKDKPLKIKNKPIASTGGQCSGASGTTTLRVTFDKSAKVTKVDIVSSSSCEYFDRSAIQSARKIEFEPAVKNGVPITLAKTVVYTFTGY